MGLINKVDMVCLSPVGYGVLADVSSVSPSSEQTGELFEFPSLLRRRANARNVS